MKSTRRTGYESCRQAIDQPAKPFKLARVRDVQAPWRRLRPDGSRCGRWPCIPGIPSGRNELGGCLSLGTFHQRVVDVRCLALGSTIGSVHPDADGDDGRHTQNDQDLGGNAGQRSAISAHWAMARVWPVMQARGAGDLQADRRSVPASAARGSDTRHKSKVEQWREGRVAAWTRFLVLDHLGIRPVRPARKRRPWSVSAGSRTR